MKKLMALSLAIILLVSLFTGCAKNTGTGSEPASTESLEGKTVSIGMWGGNDAEIASLEKMILDFTEKTGIEVEKKIYTDYNTQIKADLAGGVAPDVFYVDAFLAPYFISEGVLKELDMDTVEADKFYEPLKNAFMNDGKLYAVAKDYSTLALYYNKKWLSEADLPKTQEELYSDEYLTNLKAKLPEGVTALTYNSDIARLLNKMEMGGKDITKDGGLSNLSNPEVINNLSIIYDAAKKGNIHTPADIGKGWNGEAFGNEACALMIEGNWTLGFFEQNFPELDYGVVEIPTFKNEKTTMVFTVGYGINSKAKEPMAGLEFIKYATGTEGMNTWCSGAGVLPSRDDVAIKMGVNENPFKAPHVEGAVYATPWQKGITLEVINKAFQNFFPSAVKGEITLEEAMEKADAEANNQIQ